MGVPAFFRWLSNKYTSIIVDAVEERKEIDGVKIPVNCTNPNPNFNVKLKNLTYKAMHF